MSAGTLTLYMHPLAFVKIATTSCTNSSTQSKKIRILTVLISLLSQGEESEATPITCANSAVGRKVYSSLMPISVSI